MTNGEAAAAALEGGTTLRLVLLLWAWTNTCAALGFLIQYWLSEPDLASALAFTVHTMGLLIAVYRRRSTH